MKCFSPRKVTTGYVAIPVLVRSGEESRPPKAAVDSSIIYIYSFRRVFNLF